jgi:hypothetical protein
MSGFALESVFLLIKKYSSQTDTVCDNTNLLR